MYHGPKTQICNLSLYVRRNESATSARVKKSLKKENALRLSLLLSISIVQLQIVASKLSQVRAGGRAHHKHGVFHPNTSWSHDKRDPAVNHKVSRLSNQQHDKSQLKRQKLPSLPATKRQSRCFSLTFNYHTWRPTREYSLRVHPTCGRFQLFFATSHAEDCVRCLQIQRTQHIKRLWISITKQSLFWTVQRRTEKRAECSSSTARQGSQTRVIDGQGLLVF